jgi:hypothetical protein
VMEASVELGQFTRCEACGATQELPTDFPRQYFELR